MAVKVMVARAIATGDVGKSAPSGARAPRAAAKPKRRRSSIYDADGNEVFITLVCLKCHKTRPLSQFGLRKMADGAIRNQPWCRTCRSASGPEKPKRKEPAETVDSHATAASRDAAAPGVVAAARGEQPDRRSASTVASEVAAALAAGMRR